MKLEYDSANEEDDINLDDDYEYFDLNDSEIHSNYGNRSDFLFGVNYDDDAMENCHQKSKNPDLRVLSPSRVELLSNLLKNEENKQEKYLTNVEAIKLNNDVKRKNFFYDLIDTLSSKYFTKNSKHEDSDASAAESSEQQNFRKMNKIRHDYDDPDTPPSSPINLPNK